MQNANIIDIIESMENYKVTMGRKELEVNAAKPFLVALANAALNTAISGFNFILSLQESAAENRERTADALAEMDDEERRTAMQEFNEQETFMENLKAETACAARLYNHLMMDFVDEKDQFSRPMAINAMIAFRAGMSNDNRQDAFLREKAETLGITLAEAKAITRPRDIQIAMDFCKRAPEIHAMIVDAGEYTDETIGAIEIPVMHQLSWAKKLVDKSMANADKRIANCYNKETIMRANVAKVNTIENCKMLEQFSNQLIDDNAEMLYDLESRGRIVPVVDIESARAEAKATMIATAKARAAKLEAELKELQEKLVA